MERNFSNKGLKKKNVVHNLQCKINNLRYFELKWLACNYRTLLKPKTELLISVLLEGVSYDKNIQTNKK